MKYVLTTLSTLCCFAAGLRAQNNSDKPELFEIVAQDDISTPIYRRKETADEKLQAYYYPGRIQGNAAALSGDWQTCGLNENRLIRLQLLLVALCLSLILLLTIWTMSHIRHKREREYEEILNCYKTANEALEASNDVLQGKIDNLKQDCDELEKKLERLKKSFVAVYKDKFAVVGQLCSAYMDSGRRQDGHHLIIRRVENIIAYISADENMHTHFENMINNDLNGIMMRLKGDLGDIDRQYRRFICYCIAGFPPELIGAILGMSVSNVYTKRSRLRERIKRLDSPYKEEYLRMI